MNSRTKADPAEAYREERKARIAKATKKKNKQMDPHAKRVIGRTVGIIVAVAVCLAAVYGLLNFFGVPQKLLTAVTVDGTKYSVAKYNYFYAQQFINTANTAYSYDQNYSEGMGKMLTGFDYKVSPSEQTTTDADGNEITYAEKFKTDAIAAIEKNDYYYKQATAAGFTLDGDIQTEINEAIDSIRTSAKNSGYSLNRYITKQYGKGLNEKMVREIMTRQEIVEHYLEDYKDSIGAKVTDEEIDAVYNEDPAQHQVVNMRLFGFSLTKETAEEGETEPAAEAETEAVTEPAAEGETEAVTEAETEVETEAETEAAEGETEPAEGETEPAESETEPAAEEVTYTNDEQRERAQAMLDAITDEESFIALCREYCTPADAEAFTHNEASFAQHVTYAAAKNYIGEDGAGWLFSADRVKGDKKLFESSGDSGDYIYIILIVDPAFRNDVALRNVRHILVKFDTENMTDDIPNVATDTENLTKKALELAAGLPAEGETTEAASEAAATEAATAATTEAATDAATAEAATTDAATEPAEGETAEGETKTGDGAEAEPVLKSSYLAKAGKYLQEYLDGDKTEDSFAALADEYSDDTSTVKPKNDSSSGNAQNTNSSGKTGGLISDMDTGEYVAPFEAWAYDESRQPGDTGIIESEYGYHVMYYVSTNAEPKWKADIRESIASERATSGQKDDEANYVGSAQFGSVLEWAYKKAADFIEGAYFSNSYI